MTLDDDLTFYAGQIWEWLPARTDGRRVTQPGTIANALGMSIREVMATIVAMEKAGHIVRDSATGLQTGWHRGTPPPVDDGIAEEGVTARQPEDWMLY